MIYKHFQKPREKKNAPTRAAVIRYDKEKDNTPTIVAQGRGEVAKKIIASAQENGIPLQEDSLLLENLLELDLGTNVPPQLYQVVAEVLLLVRRANVGVQISPPVSHVQQTSYWEGEEEEEVSLEDLLRTIQNI